MARLHHVVYIAVIVALLAALVRPARPDAVAQSFQAALIAKTGNFGSVTWLGKPIWQSVLDLWTLQETIHAVGPGRLERLPPSEAGETGPASSTGSRGRGFTICPDNPVGRMLDDLRAVFADLETSTLPKMIDLDEARKPR